MRFFIGTTPKDAYMLPPGTHMMVNARSYRKKDGRWRGSRPGNAGTLFLDSGGYVFFNQFDDYPFSPRRYLDLVARYRFDLYASMDYPCEPSLAGAIADMSVEERIARTVENAARLAELEQGLGLFEAHRPTLVPVIQGWRPDDYLHCLELHSQAGTLRDYMAIGSLCVRKDEEEILSVVRAVHEAAIEMGVTRLHGFGLKITQNQRELNRLLYSRDSAVVYWARNRRQRRRWERERGGKSTYFAPTRRHKRLAVRDFAATAADDGFRWTARQDYLAETCCLLDSDEVDNGLLMALDEEQAYE